MRIVAGEARGRPLGPAPRGIRPTSDRVREALFDVLGPVAGLRVLDLFAGTGALGLEALSRGAESVVFVDEAARCARTIRENAGRLGLAARARVLCAPVSRALRTLEKEDARFDLVLVDPPYGRSLGETALVGLVSSAILRERGTVVVETATRDPRPFAAGLVHGSARRYGDTTLHFYVPSDTKREAARA